LLAAKAMITEPRDLSDSSRFQYRPAGRRSRLKFQRLSSASAGRCCESTIQ